jgi:DNA-binding response OmpR family regulator
MIKKRGTDKLDSVVLNQHRALSPPNQQFYRDGHLLVDLRDRVVMLDSQILTLTRTEYRLLALFVEHGGDVVPRPVLLMLTPTMDVHLRRLRKN